MSTISNDEVQFAYAVGKEFCAGKLSRTQGIAEIHEKYGTNKTSASNMLGVIQSMLNGETYKRTINLYATRYFLDKIGEDYGRATQQKAALSTLQHVEYYSGLKTGGNQQAAKKIAETILRTKGPVKLFL
ncbi:MAG TPA: hypothetical protein DEB31_10960, partial [Clostridiales bacterium]|nr:hypothetical protein [Clostridiales bacterium]